MDGEQHGTVDEPMTAPPVQGSVRYVCVLGNVINESDAIDSMRRE